VIIRWLLSSPLSPLPFLRSPLSSSSSARAEAARQKAASEVEEARQMALKLAARRALVGKPIQVKWDGGKINIGQVTEFSEDGETKGKHKVKYIDARVEAARQYALPEAVASPENLTGRSVTVRWAKREYYKGTIEGFDASTGKHQITYDDGDKKSHDLKDDPKMKVFSDRFVYDGSEAYINGDAKWYDLDQKTWSEVSEAEVAEALATQAEAAQAEAAREEAARVYALSVPMSPFSLKITAQIEAQEARGADMDFALMGRLKNVDLPEARALDVAAHAAHLACVARKAELDAPLAAAMKAGDHERCNALQQGVKEAAAQLEAATDARAKEWHGEFSL
jgi:small nuclear ribonucleoprotein (snRNP)-like protein